MRGGTIAFCSSTFSDCKKKKIRASHRAQHATHSHARATLHRLAYHNGKLLFAALFPGFDELKRKEDNSRGFNHWFQWTLGTALIKHGVKKAREEAGSSAPHFIPRRPGPAAAAAPTTDTREGHTLKPIGEIVTGRDSNRNASKFLSRGYCKLCLASAVQNTDKEKTNWSRKIWTTDGAGGFKKVPQPSTGCSKCKVCLCADCFDSYDHENHRAPLRAVPVKSD